MIARHEVCLGELRNFSQLSDVLHAHDFGESGSGVERAEAAFDTDLYQGLILFDAFFSAYSQQTSGNSA